MIFAGLLIRPILRVSITAIAAAAVATVLGFDPISLIEPVISDLTPF